MTHADEFDTFLQNAAEQDQHARELEAASQLIQQGVASALHAAGFIPVVRDEQRLRAIEDQARSLAEEDPDATADTHDAYVDMLIRTEATKEEFAILMIMQAAAELEDAGTSLREEELQDQKRLLYAQLVVSYNYDPGNPILAVVNTYLPGGPIDPDAPDMISYYASAIQHDETALYHGIQTQAELHELLKGQGLTETDALWNDAFNTLCFMSLETRIHRAGSLGQASLAEKLEIIAKDLPPALRRPLINYFLALPTDSV